MNDIYVYYCFLIPVLMTVYVVLVCLVFLCIFVVMFRWYKVQTKRRKTFSVGFVMEVPKPATVEEKPQTLLSLEHSDFSESEFDDIDMLDYDGGEDVSLDGSLDESL